MTREIKHIKAEENILHEKNAIKGQVAVGKNIKSKTALNETPNEREIFAATCLPRP